MRSVPLPFLSKITLLWTRAREPGPVSPVKVDSSLPFPWTQRGEIYSKGDPYDNAVAENFFSCLKCELVHLRRFDSRRAAQADLFTYIEAFYNTIRPHSSLGWLPPRDFEKRLLDWEAA